MSRRGHYPWRYQPRFGTRSGLRKYLRLLRRANLYVRNSGDRVGVVRDGGDLRLAGPRRGVCDKPVNRKEQRWLERYWNAEEKTR